MKPKLPQNPVFIVGYPRSGTTLLQRYLVAQPGYYSFPESHYFSVVERRVTLGANGIIPAAVLDFLLAALDEKAGFQFSDQDRLALTTAAREGALSSKQVFELMAWRRLMPQKPQANALGAWRWVEKTPTHANFLERILSCYPQAQIVHMVRHPVPAISSRRRKFPFNRETPLEQLANAWERLEANVQRGRELFPGRILTLRYEDLVAGMEKKLAAIGEFLGTPWDMERPDPAAGAQAMAPLILPVESWKLEDSLRQVANTNETYRGMLPPRDVERIEAIVGPAMRRHGYGHFASTGDSEVI